ncbi:MAG: CoA transferase [Pseudonocardia sp.]|uniref:CaiB/BaiF CoA transferase family protein n=1 Tax=unclassified Pseudonocardia TaxID=2619320 RepID=UPI00086F3D7E|nr:MULTISPECIES: CaiB/BaiF CoA-transferase family protein [unclassified Pseudonocardia]MBN9112307.1 CoA transferase [Pseudonocardia sp.]ODV01039.1 MAG: carnitine dehydratase [Pseudonocardia sp. SCN 73-27]
MTGPLSGVRVVELAGLGPAPFAGMMLADMGADVIRVDRVTRHHEVAESTELSEVIERGRRSIAVNLKDPRGVAIVLDLVAGADALMEGYRPGVAERLGVGPAPCLARNPALVYGRMTGWGQDGPLAPTVGHDVNYIALTGVLDSIGPAGGGDPVLPLNLVGDFGGGGMLLAFGLVCGIVSARTTGRGQVVDAAMVDGAALLMAPYLARSEWGPRGTNMVDGGAHFYGVYATADDRHVAVGALEPQFYAVFLDRLGLADTDLPAQMDQASWPAMRRRVDAIFRSRTRDEWCAVFAGAETCFAPVLSRDEAASDPHLSARGTIVTRDGLVQPAPAPRFDATPATLPPPRPRPGEHGDALLAELGVDAGEVAALRASGAIG